MNYKEVSDVWGIKTHCKISLPKMSSDVQAGFASAADEYLEKELDLNELMIKHPAATFFVRVQGDSMKEAAIHSGDILVVDRAIVPSSGKIVVACINGDFLVKRLCVSQKGICLKAENPLYPSIAIDAASCDFQIWGVVTYVIHKAE